MKRGRIYYFDLFFSENKSAPFSVQPGMGERKVGKRIDSANVWSKPTALYQCAQLIKLAAVLPGEDEVITRVLAPGLNDVLWLRNVHDRLLGKWQLPQSNKVN
ncbi:hypothetical protein D3C76_939460 [compost metagenome]